ncbi:MAG TPA: sigma-70 family RNA polymerase sigma factor [Nannocystaceae bacterium]|nr:sigma-70 family RNA polymerase sigma factor [Nannocystaceae bacterium]
MVEAGEPTEAPTPRGIAACEALLAARPRSVTAEERDAIARILDLRLREAEARWPRLRANDGRFAATLARLVPEDADVLAALTRLHAVDLLLASACLAGDSIALALFDGEVIDPIDRMLGHMRLPGATVDEVKQLVRTKLLVVDGERAPRLTDYSGRGDLRGWVGVIATREALSLLRRGAKTPIPAEDVLLAAPSPLTGPELGFLKEHYRGEFRSAFTLALDELSPRERNVLRHHYVHGLTIDEIGAMYGIHRSNAARRIGKAREQLLTGTRRRLVLGLEVARSEFESIMRLIESRIDVSIQRMLGPDDAHDAETHEP